MIIKKAFYILAVCIFLILNYSFSSAKNFDPVRTFYSSLQPYGHWLNIHGGLLVWKPISPHPYWRPYIDGYWLWTKWGWYWVSNEPFGWIVYHYGRWHFDQFYGWIWIPDNEWAPAWVEWRYSDFYIGWAPLPPVGLPRVIAYERHFYKHPPRHCWWYVPYEHFNEHHSFERIYYPQNEDFFKNSKPIKGIYTENVTSEQQLTPEFINQKRAKTEREKNYSKHRVFGPQRSNERPNGRTLQNNNSGDNLDNSNDLFTQVQPNRDKKIGRSEQQPPPSPRVNPEHRVPHERRQELMERYERNRITPPQRNQQQEEKKQFNSEQQPVRKRER